MKRSVVLKLVHSLLECELELDLDTRADNLLCHLEDIGMLPPIAQITRQDYYTTGHEFIGYFNKWEKE